MEVMERLNLKNHFFAIFPKKKKKGIEYHDLPKKTLTCGNLKVRVGKNFGNAEIF